MPIKEEARQVVRQFVETFNRGDLSAPKGLLTEDAELQGVFGKGLFEKIEPIWHSLPFDPTR